MTLKKRTTKSIKVLDDDKISKQLQGESKGKGRVFTVGEIAMLSRLPTAMINFAKGKHKNAHVGI